MTPINCAEARLLSQPGDMLGRHGISAFGRLT